MRTLLTLLTSFVALSALAFDEPATNKLTGNWLGTLDAGGAKLRLLFKISQTSSGVLNGKVDSLDQGARDLPINSITVKEGKVNLEVKSVGGSYEGTLDAGAKKLEGMWRQSGQELPLTLEKQQGTVGVAAAEKLSPMELAASKVAAQKLGGVWNGTISLGAADLRLKVRITKTAAGAATGTIESVDQGVKDIPLTGITCSDGEVTFEARGIGARFEGKLSPGGSMLTGKWHQSGQATPLEFKKSAVGK